MCVYVSVLFNLLRTRACTCVSVLRFVVDHKASFRSTLPPRSMFASASRDRFVLRRRPTVSPNYVYIFVKNTHSPIHPPQIPTLLSDANSHSLAHQEHQEQSVAPTEYESAFSARAPV